MKYRTFRLKTRFNESRSMFVLSMTGLMLWFAGSVNAEQRHDHEHDHHHETTAAHVHGEAELNMVITEGQVLAELHSPLAHFLGFEHQPKTSEQQQTYQTFFDAMQNVDAVFTLNGGNCQPHATAVNEPAEGEAATQTHSSFNAEYMLRCDDLAEIRGVHSPLFSVYPSLMKINVQLIREMGQTAFTLTAEQPGHQW